jgi:hypothetical protein
VDAAVHKRRRRCVAAVLAARPGHRPTRPRVLSGAFTVIRGELNEVRIDPYGQATSHSRPAGTATSLAPGVIHDVSGAGIHAAVSIHAYSPPLREMNYYLPDAHGQLQITRTMSTYEPEQELTE